MDSIYQYYSDHNKASGWKETWLADSFRESEKSYDFNISGKPIQVLIRKVGQRDEQTSDVYLFHGTSFERAILGQLDPIWENISGEDYKNLRGKFSIR